MPLPCRTLIYSDTPPRPLCGCQYTEATNYATQQRTWLLAKPCPQHRTTTPIEWA